jgi:hypothetical protein
MENCLKGYTLRRDNRPIIPAVGPRTLVTVIDHEGRQLTLSLSAPMLQKLIEDLNAELAKRAQESTC